MLEPGAVMPKMIQPKSRKNRKQGDIRTYTRVLDIASIAGDDVVSGQGGALSLRLDNLPGYTDFTNLYDQYKLLDVRIQFMLLRDPTQLTTAANKGRYPQLLTCLDRTDSNAPTLATDVMQYENCKVHVFTQATPEYDRVAPLYSAAVVYETAVTSGYSSGSRWIDVGDPNVPHYGIKWWVQDNFTGGVIRVWATVKFQTRLAK